jgi:2-polyprenyl-3-methyl-5-hydroxy-6-metoxy-1,4-benzoquinol methylase
MEEKRHPYSPLVESKSADYFDHERQEVLNAIQKAGITQASNVLELGCSSGRFGSRLSKILKAGCYVGLDSSEDAILIAAQHLDRALVCDLNTAEPSDLDLHEEEFDLLVALDVLEHLYDPWQALTRFTACLKPGGFAVVSVPNIQNIAILNGLAHGQWQYQTEGILDATHIRFFTRSTAVQLLTGVGLQIVQLGAILNPNPADLQIADKDNHLNLGRISLHGLSRDESMAFFVFQYILIGQRIG